MGITNPDYVKGDTPGKVEKKERTAVGALHEVKFKILV